MAGSSHQDGGIIAGINVTPLVDITLVLLVIFIVTAKIVVTPAVPLDLPHASHGDEVQVVLSVIVPAVGATLVNGEAVPDDEALRARAREWHSKNPEIRAVINADGNVPHRRVIRTLDLLKTAGIAHVAFGIAPESRP
ncbi:MAG: biopolymer transporter ExbD [Deltaproteobacteria bacterium]|nr:biopolymer transporter ExbD [Deltaproteobacteria bacterium]